MAVFSDGTVQRARVRFTNPKAQAITYTGKFYLALPSNLNNPVNAPAVKDFSVAAQGASDVDFSVDIPLLTVQQLSLVACLQVLISGSPIVTFVGAEAVVVNFSPAVSWGDIVWNP